jgi:hypothetical protein
LNYRLRYFWQPDEGYQKCKGMNRGIVLAQSDSDLHRRRLHSSPAVRCALPGRWANGKYPTGGYCKLPLALSQRITREDVVSGRATDYRWLAANGLERHTLQLGMRSETLRHVFNAITPVKSRLHGPDASAWKEDGLRVNGWTNACSTAVRTWNWASV